MKRYGIRETRHITLVPWMEKLQSENKHFLEGYSEAGWQFGISLIFHSVLMFAQEIHLLLLDRDEVRFDWCYIGGCVYTFSCILMLSLACLDVMQLQASS